jgi:hypothetical protein
MFDMSVQGNIDKKWNKNLRFEVSNIYTCITCAFLACKEKVTFTEIKGGVNDYVCSFLAELVLVEVDTTTLTTHTYILPRRKNKNKKKGNYIYLLFFLLSHFSKNFVLCETE